MKVVPHGGYSDYPMQVLIGTHYHLMDETGYVPRLDITVPQCEWEIEPTNPETEK